MKTTYRLYIILPVLLQIASIIFLIFNVPKLFSSTHIRFKFMVLAIILVQYFLIKELFNALIQIEFKNDVLIVHRPFFSYHVTRNEIEFVSEKEHIHNRGGLPSKYLKLKTKNKKNILICELYTKDYDKVKQIIYDFIEGNNIILPDRS